MLPPKKWEGFKSSDDLKVYDSWFQAYFRMSVRWFEALLWTLVPHLRRKSSSHPH